MNCDRRRRWRLGIVILGVMFSGASQAAPADSVLRNTSGIPALEPGTALRLASSADLPGALAPRVSMFRATLLRATVDSLWVQPSGRDQVLPLALSNVRLEVFAGRSHLKGTFTGAAIGLMVGLGAGLVAAAIYTSQSSEELAGLSYIVYPVLGATVAVPAGAIIGGVRGVDRWGRVRQGPGSHGRSGAPS